MRRAAQNGRIDARRPAPDSTVGTHMKKTLYLDNHLAALLVGEHDAHLRQLESLLAPCDLSLRGNELTLEGSPDQVEHVADLVDQTALPGRVRAHPRRGDGRAGRVAGQRRQRPDAPVGRHRRRRHPGAPGPAYRAQDGQPEGLRRRHPQEHHHLRHRAGRHGQDLPGHGDGHPRAPLGRGGAHHPHPAGRRSGREARLSARHPAREGRPVPASPLRRPVRHDGLRAPGRAPGARDHRGRSAGLHARAYAQRQLHHPRRGPEHHARADEDVPDPAGVRREDGGHGRHHPDRPAPGSALGSDHRARHPGRSSPTSPSCTSTATTWCGTGWCRTSSRRTSSTPTSSRPTSSPGRRATPERARRRVGTEPAVVVPTGTGTVARPSGPSSCPTHSSDSTASCGTPVSGSRAATRGASRSPCSRSSWWG